jgi:tetratricopeptide (TPR) repeat protein
VASAQVSTPTAAVAHSANNTAIQKAFGCLQKGEFQEAEELFRQVYILDPEDSRGPIGLGESYLSEGRADDAIDLLSVEIGKRPDHTDLRLALGNLYMRTEQYDLAIAEFQSALDTGRNLSATAKAELLNHMGEANRLKGDLNEAMRLFKAAAELDPKSAASLLKLAMILDGVGKTDQAAPIYEQVLKLLPDNVIALNNLPSRRRTSGRARVLGSFGYLSPRPGETPLRPAETRRSTIRGLRQPIESRVHLGRMLDRRRHPG